MLRAQQEGVDLVVVVLVGAWLALATFLVAGWRRINSDDRRWRIGALLLVLVFSVVHQLLLSAVVEDAYVTFRYVDNLVAGNGPVFNIGGQVEGYSDFSWLILLALTKALFGSGIVTTAVVLGLLCTLGSVLVAYGLVNRVVSDARPEGHDAPGLGVVAAALTAGASSLAAYGMSGLPTSLFLLLVLGLCFALAAYHPLGGGLLAALAVMTRPDGFVVALVALAWLVVHTVRGRTTVWTPGSYLIGLLLLVGPWMVWRLLYYDQLVPRMLAGNSPAFGGDWQNLSSFVLAHHGVLLLTVAAVAGLSLWRQGERVTRRARGLVWFILTLTVVYLAAILSTTGEIPVWRLLAPVPPLLAVAATAAYGVLAAPGRPRTPRPQPRPLSTTRRLVPSIALALCGMSLIVSVTHPVMLPAVQDSRRVVAEAAEIGSWLEATLPAGTVVSSYGSAVLAFEAGTELIVTSARIGYRGDAPGTRQVSYVAHTRRPAVVVATDGGYQNEQHCAIAPSYAGQYEVATFRRSGTSRWVPLYLLAPRASRLIARLSDVPEFEYVPCRV